MGDPVIVITCIRPEALRKIRERGEGTLELRSHQNVSAANELKVGDLVFITDEGYEDVRRGTGGIIATVERKNIDFKRSDSPHGDEWDVIVARLRIRLVSTASVRKVYGGRILNADVAPHTHAIIG